MLAIYDLAVAPPTYDFIAFLVAAERARKQAGEDSFKVLIVRGPDHGFRKDDLPPRDPAERQKMLENIVFPMCQFVPSCDGYEVAERFLVSERMRGQYVFPSGYTPENPVMNYGLAVMASCANEGVMPLAVRDFTPDPDLVTITLREAPYWPTRNSIVAEWIKVAAYLTDKGKRVVFVRDTAKADEPIEAYETSPEASRDLGARMRLYASACLNLFTGNGPAWVPAFCSQISLMIFKVLAPNAPCTNEEFFARCGFPKGSQFMRPGMKIVWEDDNAETIIREIEAGLKDSRAFKYANSANVEKTVIVENMRENCKRDLPWLLPRSPHSDQMVIVGGGPSVLDHIGSIKERRRRGQAIFALNNAWRVLPFAPDFIVCMDSRPENAAFFEGAPDSPTYLIASTAHPSVFDTLAGKNIMVWHADQAIPEQREILDSYSGAKPGAMFGGGATVGLRTIIVGYMMGFRREHLYGMDSSYQDGKHHAYAQSLNDNEKIIEIIPQGFEKTYMCAPWMARQADEFQQFYKSLLKRGPFFIQAHGEGLLPDLCRHINRQITAKQPEKAA